MTIRELLNKDIKEIFTTENLKKGAIILSVPLVMGGYTGCGNRAVGPDSDPSFVEEPDHYERYEWVQKGNNRFEFYENCNGTKDDILKISVGHKRSFKETKHTYLIQMGKDNKEHVTGYHLDGPLRGAYKDQFTSAEQAEFDREARSSIQFIKDEIAAQARMN